MIISADLSDQYYFPTSLAYSNLRPGLVAYSDPTKTAITVGTDRLFRDKLWGSKVEKGGEVLWTGWRSGRQWLRGGLGHTGSKIERLFVNYDSFDRLNEAIGVSKKELHELMCSLSITTISHFRSGLIIMTWTVPELSLSIISILREPLLGLFLLPIHPHHEIHPHTHTVSILGGLLLLLVYHV